MRNEQRISAPDVHAGLSLAATGVGKKGCTPGAGRGREVIPIRAVSSVATRKDGPLNTIVAISSPSGIIDMRVSHREAEQIRSTINDLMGKAHQVSVTVEASAATEVVDLTEQLAKLSSLRDSGILTEEEFAAKKAEILSRI